MFVAGLSQHHSVPRSISAQQSVANDQMLSSVRRLADAKDSRIHAMPGRYLTRRNRSQPSRHDVCLELKPKGSEFSEDKTILHLNP